MSRGGAGGRAAGGASRPASTHRPPPQPVNHAPPPGPVRNNSGGPMSGGIGSVIAEGMAFGTGSAVAHRAVDAVMGPWAIQHEAGVTQAAAVPAATVPGLGVSDACSMHSEALKSCVKSFGGDVSQCQFLIDLLAECRRISGSTMSS